MRKNFGWKLVVLGCLTALTYVTNIRADDAADDASKASSTKKTSEVYGSNDKQVAAFLQNGCRNEVQFAKFALPLLHTDQAKEFATMMIKDHQAMCDKLAGISGVTHHGAAGAPRVGREAREERREARAERRADDTPAIKAAAVEVDTNRQPAVDVRVGTAANRGAFDWATVHHQIAAQCLATAEAELKDKHGEHVDKCYIGMQIAAHMKMVDELKVVRGYVSSEFSAELDKAQQTATDHLQEAKRIMEKQAGKVARADSTKDK